MRQPDSRWFSVLPGNGHEAALRLYCFPHAGAGHTVFQHWRAALPGDIELALVKLPGRGARFGEPRGSSLNALAAALAQEIAEASATGKPFAVPLLEGWSAETRLGYRIWLLAGGTSTCSNSRSNCWNCCSVCC